MTPKPSALMDTDEPIDQLAPPKDEIPPPPVAVSAAMFQNQILEFSPCVDPDCVLVSLDGSEFLSKKELLGSIFEVFADMLDAGGASKGESNDTSSSSERIELVETSHVISLLLTIAHSKPPVLPELARRKFQEGKPEADIRAAHTYEGKPPPEGLLPFENVRELIHPLGQKYQLASEVLDALRSHLGYHIPAYPLQVYTLASELAEGGLVLSYSPNDAALTKLTPSEEKKYWSALASDASQYLLTPTLTTLPLTTALKFPTAESYAALLYFQIYRIDALRALLRDTDKSIVFPYDYGICKDHVTITRKLWDRRLKTLEDELDAGTDVAEEMGKTCEPPVRHCATCSRGVKAAVEMLRVRVFDTFEDDDEVLEILPSN